MSRDMDRNSNLPVVSTTVTPPRILRLKEVCRMTGLGRSSIYQLQAERRFPVRIKLGVRAVGWLEDDVQQWLAQRITASHLESPAG
jgi:prophage regulatory protein